MEGWELLCGRLGSSQCPSLLPVGPTLVSTKLLLATRGLMQVDIARIYLAPVPGRQIRSFRCVALKRRHCKGIRAGTGDSAADLQDTRSCTDKLLGRVVAFTTPTEYAHRLENVLTSAGAKPLWCPTIVVESTPATRLEVVKSLWGASEGATSPGHGDSSSNGIQGFMGIAFTSRAGIRAVAEALDGKPLAVSEAGEPFILTALGRDMDLLQDLHLVSNKARVRYLTPPVATPASLVEALGPGRNQRILCPVPLVQDLQEPHVVPAFLQALSQAGWQPVRVNAYVTRWAGTQSTQLLTRGLPHPRLVCDALVFTSTAEVEGLLKGLQIAAQDLNSLTKGRCLVAAHGPVTTEGASRLGVRVDVVGSKFHSFAGIVGALSQHFESTFEKLS